MEMAHLWVQLFSTKSLSSLPLCCLWWRDAEPRRDRNSLWTEMGFMEIEGQCDMEHELLLLLLLRAHKPRPFQVCLAPSLLPCDLASSPLTPCHDRVSPGIPISESTAKHYQTLGERRASLTLAPPPPSDTYTQMPTHTHTRLKLYLETQFSITEEDPFRGLKRERSPLPS